MAFVILDGLVTATLLNLLLLAPLYAKFGNRTIPTEASSHDMPY
jgi:Cu/Ag efflux pump CusA